VTDSRARLLRAAVGFALVQAAEPELVLLHRWLDNWRGVGDVVAGMKRARRRRSDSAMTLDGLIHLGEFTRPRKSLLRRQAESVVP